MMDLLFGWPSFAAGLPTSPGFPPLTIQSEV
jgi:hypothetical protein